MLLERLAEHLRNLNKSKQRCSVDRLVADRVRDHFKQKIGSRRTLMLKDKVAGVLGGVSFLVERSSQGRDGARQRRWESIGFL